ncbi:hypothetical protein BGZ76_001856 [Entomortierella beljakovae]|nr:hypothetical protein BGZ76_001856 [Entomortierella beljakovae]
MSSATTIAEDSKSYLLKDDQRKSVRDYLEEESWNEYLIVGRPLPTGYFENHNQDEINTTIENVIHMMKLVACYLGIKLPFNIFLKDSRYYVQTAFSMSSKRFPIFLTGSNINQFAVGLGGLNYNIAYLCHSQGVHITSPNATNTLENLLACCQATNLGRYTNYADIMAKQPEGIMEFDGTIEDDVPLSPARYDGDLEIIKPGTRKIESRNENLMWCPGQEPFDLNVNEIIIQIRSRRDEESSVLGEFHLQDAIATGLEETIEDDYFLQVDFDEDGVFDFDPHEAELGLIHSSLSNPGNHIAFKSESSLAPNQRRLPHPSRSRQQSQPPSERSDAQLNANDLITPTKQTKHSKSENWTLLDIDISPIPSSVSKESGILSGRGWPDISVLKKVGSAVGGAAVGLVNGASNVAGVASARGSRFTRRIPNRSSSRDSSYSSISSSAP